MIFVRPAGDGKTVELCVKDDGKDLQVLPLKPERAYTLGLDLLDEAHKQFTRREDWDKD